MNFKEIFEKNVTYDDNQSDLKQRFALSSGSLFFEMCSLDKAWVFLNETSILVFVKLAIFHFI